MQCNIASSIMRARRGRRPPSAGAHRRPPRNEIAMGLDLVATGRDVPNEINVIIEIPKDAEPVKYEVDKATGAIFVDRILSTPMRYPCNYGYVPHTLCGDGDPADVLVILPLPLIPGSVIRCRPVGMLQMTDEAGTDTKLLAVPVDKVFSGYSHIQDIAQVSQHWLDRIGHFFEHYKDLEKGKWVKLDGWQGADAARREIVESIERYNAMPESDKNF
jgi:inorganic pyrophosphatase